MTTENNQKPSSYIKDSREAVNAQVLQSECQNILMKQNDSALMTRTIDSRIETEACRVVKSPVKTNFCPNVI